MGDYTYSKPKVGHSIARAKQTSSKLLSVFLAIIMVTTVFSSIVIADDQGTDPVGDDSSTDAGTTQRGKIGGIIKELINRIRENRKGIFSLGLVTRYQKDGSSNIKETSTRMRLLLPTGIDIDGDGDNDIRVWVIRRPALDLRPPAIAWKTTILVRRLSGMDEDMIYDFFEIYLEYNPRVPSGLAKLLSGDEERFVRIRMGYQSPADEEIPKYCIVSHKDIPHFIYPKQKNAHRVSINPGVIADNSQLNLLFSIADMKDDTVLSELNLQINHSPAVKNEFSIERSKDYFVRRGQTLEISRNNVNSNVSLYVKEGPLFGGSLTVESLPKKITLGWKLARTGYVEISTEGSKTGAIKYKVNGAVDMGFKPETALNFRIDWKSPYLLGRLLQKGYNLELSGGADAILSDFYVHAETIDWTASKLSLNLGGGGGVYNFKLLKSQLDTVYVEVENVDVAIENSVITVIPPEAPEKPTVSITSPEDGDTVEDIVSITGTAESPSGQIQSVAIAIDGGEEIVATGTMSWSYDWDTNALSNGKHTISARSFDGSYWSDPDKISVIVENEGNNWIPYVEITSPSKILDHVVTGIVHIAGTATDPDPEDELTVKLTIFDEILKKVVGEFNPTVDETGHWSYEWNTADLHAGLYTIKAKSYDGIVYSQLDSVSVWVRLKIDLTVSLLDASVNVTNFVIQGPSATIDVSTFTGSGSGSVNIADGAVSADFSASLALHDFSILMTNETGVTQLSVENLSADLSGYGRVVFSQDEIGIEVNASVYLDFDSLYIAGIPIIGALDLGAFIFEGSGLISIGIDIGDENITIGGYEDKDEVTIEASDLKINVSGSQGKYFEVGANEISMHGNGSISLSDNRIDFQGSLKECVLDNFYADASLGTLSISGEVYFSSTATLTIDLNDALSFGIYSGSGYIEIHNPKIEVISSSNHLLASASYMKIDQSGYASFSYDHDEFNVTCKIDIEKMRIENLLLVFNEHQWSTALINGSFHSIVYMSANIQIELGEDYIKITIGGGPSYVRGWAEFDVNEKDGYLNVDVELEPTETLVILISGLSGEPEDITLSINGSLLYTKIRVFELYLEDTINISIDGFTVETSFDIQVSGDEGKLHVDVTDAERIMELGSIYVEIVELFNMSLQGHVNVSTAAGATGTIDLTWDDSGNVTEIDVNASSYVEVNITDLAFNYSNYKTNASVDLITDQILIRGNRTIIISDEYIRFISHDTNVEDLETYQKGDAIPMGFVIKGFTLNISDLIAGEINVKADIAYLQILRGLDIYYDGNITLDASGNIYGEDINVTVSIGEYIETYIAASLGLVSITGDATASVIIDEENISVVASGNNLNVNIKETSIDFIGFDILLALEDLDVDFVGDASFVLDFSQDDVLVVTITPSSNEDFVQINTLWIFALGIEARVDGFTMSGTTTIRLSLTPNLLATIHTDGSIDIRMFTILGFQLYGVSGGQDISVGIDELGNIIFGFDGVWHVDHILGVVPIIGNFSGYGILPRKPLVGDLSVSGKLDQLIIGLNGVLSGESIYLYGKASQLTYISLRGYTGIVEFLNFSVDPGVFTILIDFDPIGVLFFAESFINVHVLRPANPLLPRLRDISGRGYIEFNYYSNTSFSLNPLDVNFSLQYKTNGEWFIGNKINVTGNRKGYISVDAGGSSLDDFYLSVKMSWDGTIYKTIPKFIKICVNKSGSIDFDYGYDNGTGNNVIVTSQAMVVMNDQNSNFITVITSNGNTYQVYETGQMTVQYNNSDTTTNYYYSTPQEALESINELEIEIHRRIHIWRWRPFHQDWKKIWPPFNDDEPKLDSEVTLLTRDAEGSIYNVGGIDILPGDSVNYTAWFIPGQDTSGPSNNFTFTFDFDEGNTTAINRSKGEPYIKLHPDFEPVYYDVKTYTPTVDVTDDPIEYAFDSTKVNVVEDYLRVETVKDFWNYEDIPEELGQDGKLHGAYIVKNVANETLSTYNLHWNVTADIPWAPDWTPDKTQGTLGPNESERVNFSFTPPTTPGDYSGGYILFTDTVQPQYTVKKSISIEYGLVFTAPFSPVLLPMESGEIKTFEDVFWIFSNRYEPLHWGIVNVTAIDFDIDAISYTFIPNTSLMQPYEPTGVDLYIDASNPAFKGGTMMVKIQRVGDVYDNSTVNISILVADQGILNEWVSPDSHTETDWKFKPSAYDEQPILTWAVYKKLGANDWSDDLILKLNTPIDTTGCWIRARNGIFLDKLNIILYDGTTQVAGPFTITSWKNRRWTHISFEGEYEADIVKIAFHENDPLGGFFVHRPHVYEFYFVESG